MRVQAGHLANRRDACIGPIIQYFEFHASYSIISIISKCDPYILNRSLARQLILNNPGTFSKQNDGRIWQSNIECGDGWYDLIDQLGDSLNALARQTDISIFVPLVTSRLGALWVRWECQHQLLANERSAISEVLIRHAFMSRSICEVCARKLRPLPPMNPRCPRHEGQ